MAASILVEVVVLELRRGKHRVETVVGHYDELSCTLWRRWDPDPERCITTEEVLMQHLTVDHNTTPQ